MSITSAVLKVSDFNVRLTRKDIKNVHLSVVPPDGKVCISVPLHITDDNARLMVVNRISWIKKRIAEFKEQRRETERQFVKGESHYFEGRRYLLDVDRKNAPRKVNLKSKTRLHLSLRPNDDRAAAGRLLDGFYRVRLKERLQDMLPKWTTKVGAVPTNVSVRKMKTKWGSCNPQTGRILINLELAKKPLTCVEYILVHELIHLHERRHNEEFRRRMNEAMPDWPNRRERLKAQPLAFEHWSY